jgi:hypothetical protein
MKPLKCVKFKAQRLKEPQADMVAEVGELPEELTVTIVEDPQLLKLK